MSLLRRTIAIAAAYAVALQGLLAFSVLTAHIGIASDRPSFALCSGGASGAADHERLPSDEQAHCLQLCLAATNAAGCEPNARAQVAKITPVGAALSVTAEAPYAVVARIAANRPRAPPV